MGHFGCVCGRGATRPFPPYEYVTYTVRLFVSAKRNKLLLNLVSPSSFSMADDVLDLIQTPRDPSHQSPIHTDTWGYMYMPTPLCGPTTVSQG